MTAPRVLVVDDDPVARQYLTEVLHALGARVDCADSGMHAHALARAQRYALLLVDRRLPDTEAGAWLRGLRGDPTAASQATTAIVQSAALQTRDRLDMRAAGFRSAHEKPIPREVLAGLLGLRHAAGQQAIAASSRRIVDDSTAPVLDDLAGIEACGSPEILADLRQLLHAELAQHQRALVHAFSVQDPAAVDAIAHRLAGAARYCGAPALLVALSRLRSAAPESSPATLDEVLAAIDTLARTLAPPSL